MLVAVDLDGPCYEFTRTVRYMLNHYRGRDLPPLEEFWTSRYPPEIPQEDWDWVFTRGVELGVFRYGHMMKDTRVGLQSLVDLGHEIVIITKRPKEAWEDTKEWVDFYYKGIPLLGLYTLTDEESKADAVPGARVLIDDMPENVADWAVDGKPAILFKQPWNVDARFDTARIKQANGWKEVIEWFKSAASAISKAEQSWNRV